MTSRSSGLAPSGQRRPRPRQKTPQASISPSLRQARCEAVFRHRHLLELTDMLEAGVRERARANRLQCDLAPPRVPMRRWRRALSCVSDIINASRQAWGIRDGDDPVRDVLCPPLSDEEKHQAIHVILDVLDRVHKARRELGLGPQPGSSPASQTHVDARPPRDVSAQIVTQSTHGVAGDRLFQNEAGLSRPAAVCPAPRGDFQNEAAAPQPAPSADRGGSNNPDGQLSQGGASSQNEADRLPGADRTCSTLQQTSLPQVLRSDAGLRAPPRMQRQSVDDAWSAPARSRDPSAPLIPQQPLMETRMNAAVPVFRIPSGLFRR
jgi:hypothetical protein